ncbi:TIR domain-containing protein [Chlorobium phaeobacteroides]|jgi:hypothetical protein|uniref:Thoeris protein ThsB TIR-like domain-containing protein n=1 Tax=Chlorobium phaeobacteroides (strain DSM 266 / SMG 266 / 2430) TaxID=290317 RepID=A1BEH3_CHLPD|nr:TIR domain-containing protein [Chlorobium phaeobacteroides]ABL64800.1 conserved hypothetical protein [Chlorobium phaeobacteroides DSM 266]MBV5319363.1 TIR domain-containing protein [Chlorobium phaeobacteroides]
MADRKGTYIAFDGLGQTNPTLSDYRYFSTIQSWATNKTIDFAGVSSHDKAYARRKSSIRASFEERIRELLTVSKQVVIVLSEKTRKSGNYLSFEIEQAVDNFDLPLIIVYADYRVVADPSLLSGYWPDSLRQRINSGAAKALHVPFNKEAFLDALSQFSVVKKPETGLNHYSEYAHRKFSCIPQSAPFENHKTQG